MSPIVTDRSRPPWLPAQLLHHRLREIDSADLDATPGERERDPSGTDRKLKRSASAGQPPERLDRGLDSVRLEHLRRGFVVGPGDFGPEVVFAHS
jgi:hypothetical protein